MPGVLDVLSQDHQEVKQMLAELENGPTKATRPGVLKAAGPAAAAADRARDAASGRGQD